MSVDTRYQECPSTLSENKNKVGLKLVNLHMGQDGSLIPFYPWATISKPY